MTSTETILQCEVCARQHDGAGTVLRTRAGIPSFQDCGLPDCAAIAAADARRVEGFNRPRRTVASCRVAVPPAHGGRAPALGRKPYVDAEDNERAQVMAPATCNLQPASAGARPQPATCNLQRATAPRGPSGTDRQAEFQASGQGESADELLKRFFSAPENFDLWFPVKFLVKVVMREQSGYMNNRAVDIRPHFEAQGLYIDNCMEEPAGGGPKVSCYRVCRIEDAVSLTEEEKAEKIRKAGGQEGNGQ